MYIVRNYTDDGRVKPEQCLAPQSPEASATRIQTFASEPFLSALVPKAIEALEAAPASILPISSLYHISPYHRTHKTNTSLLATPTTMTTTNPTRIPIPPTYTLTPPLRHRLNSALLSSNAVPHLQAALTHEAQASGWLDAIRARVYELLRSGECTTYSEIMTVVMREVKGKRGGVNRVGNMGGEEVGSGGSGGMGNGTSMNGVNGVGLGLQLGEGSGSGFTNGNTNRVGAEGRGRLAVPRRVVEAGVRIVRGVLEEVVEVTGEEGGVGEGR